MKLVYLHGGSTIPQFCGYQCDFIQVLEYMRTDVRVGGKPVLAVVLGDVEGSLKYSATEIRRAINGEKLGHIRVTKDFLVPGSRDTEVHREGNSRRRKCDAILLEKLDELSVAQLQARKCKCLH